MNLYKFATPWDYHEQGAVVVMAVDPAEASERAIVWLGKQDKWQQEQLASFLDTTPELIEGNVYEDSGCDC